MAQRSVPPRPHSASSSFVWTPQWTVAACAMACMLVLTALWSGFGGDGHSAVRSLLGRDSGSYAAGGIPRLDCNGPTSNDVRRAWIEAARNNPADPLLPQADSFEDFILELKASIDRHMLPRRTIDIIFSDESPVPPACGGDWMEFGVFTGTSVNKTARWRRAHCPRSCPPVYGLDTFTGLAEDWNPDDKMIFTKDSFSQQGNFPPVEDNVFLIKGLYSDSLPPFLKQQKIWAEGFRHIRGPYKPAPVSYLHVDCDLFAGAHDALTMLSHKIVPGTVIIFDELINYKRFREHEVKAMWMWLQVSGAKLATLGTKGPLEGKTVAMDLDVELGHDLESQSAAFVVVSMPGRDEILI